ncbi:MAG: IS630 family transposase [Gammaproteobacteria bacterium]|nr:IS630 family transposase [Gammaproteobacteria bacterium]
MDESGFAHDMPRIYAYAPVGDRCSGIHDWQAKGRTNAVGALHGNELVTVSLFDGSINSEVFHAWVKQDLLPKLPERSVVVMDNASFHKRRDIQKTVTSAGHILEYLPVYSPDLNPIERKWAQAKALRRKHRCSVDELFQRYRL